MELRCSSNKFDTVSHKDDAGRTNPIEIFNAKIKCFEQSLDRTRKNCDVLDETVKALVAKRKSFEPMMQHELDLELVAESEREQVSLQEVTLPAKRPRGRPRKKIKENPATLTLNSHIPAYYPPSSDDDLDKKKSFEPRMQHEFTESEREQVSLQEVTLPAKRTRGRSCKEIKENSGKKRTSLNTLIPIYYPPSSDDDLDKKE